MTAPMRVYDIRGLLWLSLFWLYAIIENFLALLFIPFSLVASSFEYLPAFKKNLNSLQLCFVSPWPSMGELHVQRATAYLVQLKSIGTPASALGNLLRATAIPPATCIWNMKYDWACRRASISRSLFKPCHWTKSNRNSPSTPFLASILFALPRVTSALPTRPIPKADDGTSTEFLLVLLFCSLCALGVLVAGHFIARRTGEMATYGTFMGIESMAWWLIATDPNNSILFLFTYGP